jgi:hypothetical protein
MASVFALPLPLPMPQHRERVKERRETLKEINKEWNPVEIEETRGQRICSHKT